MERKDGKCEDSIKERGITSGEGTMVTRQWLRDTMIEVSPYLCVIFSEELDVLECNQAAISYFGFSSAQAFREGFLSLLERSMPAFQPDASPTIPLSARFAYVREHQKIEFEIELLVKEQRAPLRFSMYKVPREAGYVIACYMVDTQQLKEARNELLRQDFLMRQVNRVATQLLGVAPEQFQDIAGKALKSLAQGVKAFHISLWENAEKDGEVYCSQLLCWDSERARDEMQLPLVPSRELGEWYEILSRDKRVSGQGREQLDGARTLLIPRSARAYVLIPVFLQKKFWGTIAVAKNSDTEPFNSIEEKALQSGGILIVLAALRNQINQNLIVAREAAMEGAKAKTDFLSRMSHEIRTPMNAILGMTAIARKSRDMDRIQYSLEKIETASEQLLNLINDVLDMSKIEAGKLEISVHPFDFEKMIRNVFDMVKVRMLEKNQRFYYQGPTTFDCYMLSDELRLSQVMINLLTNAVKFTGDGGAIGVKVELKPLEGERQRLYIEVEDSGIGISAEQQARLFRSFEQADGGTARRFGGTGLGLAICKSIIQLLGGDIGVRSEEEKGATFFLEVPISWGEPIGSEKKQERTDTGTQNWVGKRILLVEDIEINREIILAILEDTGLSIQTAENGLEALAAVQDREEPFDLILMDVQMPEMDGLDATKAIRNLGSLWALKVPILAMTANAFSDDVDRCLGAGMNDHIAKPIDVEIFIKKLSKYLGS